MKIIKSKTLLVTLMSIINLNLAGCANNVEPTLSQNVDEQVFELPSTTEEELEKIDYEEEKEEIVEPIEIKLVYANENVNIRDIDGEILGVLPKGKTLSLVSVENEDKYAVYYYGKIAYVSKEYTTITIGYDFNTPIKKVLYAKKDINLIVPLSLNIGEENVTIPKLECLEVYEEYEEFYLVKTNEYIGYIEKENVEELIGAFVVVDISDQKLKLYKDNEIILETPVVTGKPSSPTDEGIFAIYDITHNRYLVGPNYRSYVDIMMKYNNNEGLHDAEYHTDKNGKKHGWRGQEEFGGETYKKNGSHGCVNMLHDDVMFVSENVEKGTKVLVKK